MIILSGVAYHIDEIAPIERNPAMAHHPQLLAAFRQAGHRTYAHSDRGLAEQAVASAKKTLAAAQLSARDIEAIVLGTSEINEPKRYPEMLSTELLMALEMSEVPVVGVTLAGCANYGSSLRVARNMLVAEGLNHVLVVETNQVRGSMQRPIFENGVACAIFGDGAASAVVSTEDAAPTSGFELLAMAQTIKPLDWSRADVNTIAANNVMGFRRVVGQVLVRVGIEPSDFAMSFFSNINVRITQDTAAILSLEMPSVHTANWSRTAHVWSCDNLINLADHCAAEQVPSGALFLLVCNAESYFSAVVCRKR